ncbi:ATP-binding protein, partial [Arthrobacter sp. H20]|uniref:ATP-binding protein n=1 Tax=Arthrobacter sp. H20 TaxID=1267981 RepID=UPI0031B89F75
MVTWISHDLRTPLASMRAMAEALEDGVATDVSGYHAKIITQTDQMAEMINDLLELSKIQEGSLHLSSVPLHLYDLVSDAIADLTPLAAKKRLTVDGTSVGNPVVRGDAPTLSRAVRNLILNAILYTSEGTTVRISMTLRDGNAVIEVADHCGGIAAEDLDNVFIPGWQKDPGRTANGYSGVGVGLSMAASIIGAHQGSLCVRNTQGGCCFTASLPLVEATRGDASPSNTPTPSAAPEKKPEMARIHGWAGLAGMVAVAIAVIASELTAAAVSPSLSPVTAVGSTVVDALPPGIKDWAIEQFGTADKSVFLISMVLIIAVVAAAAGILEHRWRRAGAAVVLLFGFAGILAVAGRPQASTMAFAAPVVALVLGVMLVSVLIDRLAAWQPRTLDNAHSVRPGPVARRRFLVGVGAGAAVAAVAGAAAAGVRNSQSLVAQSRSRISLPPPRSTTEPGDEQITGSAGGPGDSGAAELPAGADLGVDGVAPLVTPNDNYYRIDTALVVPVVDPDTWRLRVTGMVEREVELTFTELLAMPLKESYITLACVSNVVGGDLIGNAKWLGWPVRELL